ncbi:TauD/TfdA family dioxygenase [Streptomyces sp. NBC_00454]|uniref:TauD/TfdA family dioxygenase n=1 Tax=Streptomyces sp. NBC_00454 TaxID=2975747 RepID=UPI0030E12EA0
MAKPSHGWTGRKQAEAEAYGLPYDPDHAALARRLRERLRSGDGFTVVRGTPARTMTTAQAQELAVSMIRPLGDPLPQGEGAERTTGWLVRDERVSQYTDDRRFHEVAYTSKSRGDLHLHNDMAVTPFGAEPAYLALLAHRVARRGGESVLADGAMVHHTLGEEYPRELGLLRTPFAFDRRHVTPAGESPVVWGPAFAEHGGHLRVRCNVRRMRSAYDLLGQPLPPDRRAAIDALEEVLSRSALSITVALEEGDCLVLNDQRILHGRTAYEDHEPLGRRRCLIRVMAAESPTRQRVPDDSSA